MTRRVRLEAPNSSLVMLIVFVPFCFLVYLTERPDGNSEDISLQDELVELNRRLRQVEAFNRNRMEDVLALQKDVKRVLRSGSGRRKQDSAHAYQRNSSVYVSRGTLWQKHFVDSKSDRPVTDLQLPSLRDYLPHLSYFDGLKPAFKVSSSKSEVSIVLGIPTVKRPVPGYLISTLQNLIDNMSESEKEDSLIIVCIAESDRDYVESEAEEIKERFQADIDSGLLEIIAPPKSYYPSLDNLRSTLGDPIERVRWRTKQNLDYAYLMMYAQPKGTFYVQLEDDILSKPSYITKMKNFAYKQLRENKDWIVLDFCQLGFIGKMFKSVDLSKLVTFFAIFHDDKPVDWLLDHMVQTKVCRFDRDRKDCKKQKDSVWIHYRPSLFQHIGTHSSLKGKVQKLKDKQFGKMSVHYPHRNPSAQMTTSLRVYRSYNLQRAYRGESFFWAKSPTKGDNITFSFTPPVLLERYYFRTGNSVHPDDVLINATVEVFPALPPRIPELIPYQKTSDDFLVLGDFVDNAGIAEGSVVPTVGPVSVLRIHIGNNCENWIILSEIAIETSPVMTSSFNVTKPSSSNIWSVTNTTYQGMD